MMNNPGWSFVGGGGGMWKTWGEFVALYGQIEVWKYVY